MFVRKQTTVGSRVGPRRGGSDCRRGILDRGPPNSTVHIGIGVMVLAVGISSMIQIYRVADAGGHSVWEEEIA